LHVKSSRARSDCEALLWQCALNPS